MHHERWRHSWMHLLRSSDPSLITMRVDRSHGNLNMKENESLGGWTAMTRFRIGIPWFLYHCYWIVRHCVRDLKASDKSLCTTAHVAQIHIRIRYDTQICYTNMICIRMFGSLSCSGIDTLAIAEFCNSYKRRNSNEELTSRLGLRTQKGAWAWPPGEVLGGAQPWIYNLFNFTLTLIFLFQ